MSKIKLAIVVCVLAAMVMPSFAGDDGKAKPWFKLSGFYAMNGYSQNNFFFGKSADAPFVGGVSDKDEYAIQMVRLTAQFGVGENIKMVVRGDVAQSIWGIDNFRRNPSEGGFSSLFGRKDTNFVTHIDWAYVDFTHPDWGWNFKIGRMKNKLGNMLVLDQDNDGVIATKLLDDGRFSFGWAKMSEGADSLSDESAIGPMGFSTEDATLYTLDYVHKGKNWTVNPFLAYYVDGGKASRRSYIPNGLQYFRARFTPQVSKAYALGFAFNGKVGKWELKGEADFLGGDDDIANSSSDLKQIIDVNDGDLSGYNFYFDAKVPAGPGKFGMLFGMGSGDDDPLRGDGNINRIRTNGFFYVTEVWEDSVMPDEEGITPQGLGSPASRGYREFENTTLVQANYTWKINPQLTYFVSGTWMQATEPIFAWAEAGGSYGLEAGDLDAVSTSDDLGWEVDMRLHWKVYPGLLWIFRTGYFSPGDGALYLVNGTDKWDEAAYELRTTIKYSFGGVKVGG